MATNYKKTTNPIAIYGEESPSVLNLQKQLNEKGANLSLDSKYGAKTKAAYDTYFPTAGPATTPITSSNLAPTNETNLPPTVPDTSASSFVETVAGQNKSEIDKRAEEAAAARTAATSDISKLLTESGVISGKQSTYEEEAGATSLQKQVDDLQGNIDLESRSLKSKLDTLRKNPQLTQELFSRTATEEERKSASYIADLTIAKSILSRDYDRAVATATKKVAMELAPVKAELEAKKFVFEANKDIWTAAESAKLNNIIKKEERQYDEEKQNREQVEELKINLRKNQIPESLFTKIANAKTRSEILDVPGIQRYLISPAEKLDMQLKGLQINAANLDILKSKAELGEKEQAKEDAKQSIRLSTKDKLDLIGNIRDNYALTGIVGTTESGRVSLRGRLSGQAAAVQANIKKLTSRETLDTLTNLKKQGGTLGSTTEKEFATLESAANNFSQWEIKDKDGNPTGEYKVSKKLFLDELQRVQTATERIYLASGGTLPGSTAERQVADDIVLQAKTHLTSNETLLDNAGY